MAEPEGLVIDGARMAAAATRDLWRRARPRAAPPVLALERVRRRLELLLGALYGAAIPVVGADPEPAPTWLARALGRAPRHIAVGEALAATDGRRVWLPRELDARGGDERAALDRYRFLAIAHGARAAFGFARERPTHASAVERDLYWIAEAAAVDRRLAGDLPGFAPELRAARAAALAARPAVQRSTVTEREVERIVQQVLAADVAAPPPELGVVDGPGDARAWARDIARRLGPARRYRGVAPVEIWGTPRLPVSPPDPPGDETPEPRPPRPARAALLRRNPRVRPARNGEDDSSPGTWMIRFDDPMQSVEDPMGLQRPADRDESIDAGELADALSDLPEARTVRTPDAARDVLQGDADAVPRRAGEQRLTGSGQGIAYPEWDHRAAVYRFPGALVRPIAAPLGGDEWAQRVLARHAPLVRRVRRRFDGLRARRARLGRQPDGADVDVCAYVTALADRRAGEPSDDRLYTETRAARRDLAIAVLADASASTDAWVSGRLRIVDVEKEALIVLLEALAALGDRHAVLAFSGQGPRAVEVRTVKGFGEGDRVAARRRVASLEADGYTRVGAAIRHASALLALERAQHRLLLLLSDGKPNDVDEYAGRYGIEDTRRAVAEARLQGLVPFCLTVDRAAPAYLPGMFGPGGYAVLSRPERLPAVVVEVIRALVNA